MFLNELLDLLNLGIRLERRWDLADIESKLFLHNQETASSKPFVELPRIDIILLATLHILKKIGERRVKCHKRGIEVLSSHHKRGQRAGDPMNVKHVQIVIR